MYVKRIDLVMLPISISLSTTFLSLHMGRTLEIEGMPLRLFLSKRHDEDKRSSFNLSFRTF